MTVDLPVPDIPVTSTRLTPPPYRPDLGHRAGAAGRTIVRSVEGGVRVAKESLTPEQALALLAETPRRIAELTAGVAATRLRTRPAAEDWSANEVLAHLRSCADVW